MTVPRDPSHEKQHKHLVSKVTHLYKDYYTVKWAGARQDVLGFYSPTWMTPLERALLWFTDWKPSMLYRVLHSLKSTAGTDGGDDDGKKLKEMRWRTGVEEGRVEREMERQQVAMADRRMVELARGGPGGGGCVEGALDQVLVGLERVMKSADCVRLKALKGVLEVLSPLQCVDFMAALLMVQLRMRRWGKMDTVRSSSGCEGVGVARVDVI
ncbi:hypothetical protein Scep_011673 [Stephania cephalantha]|uniref:DOG1 domain-containing protein n=1 Tax=Stephania cephalantha TaxID=152367 RepID=A0AAP0P8M5_9MAGN